jgi:hypothetical protein
MEASQTPVKPVKQAVVSIAGHDVLGVETLNQLAESAWGQIAAWFHQRLGW